MTCVVNLTMKVLVVLAAVLLGVQSVSCSDTDTQQWEDFKLKYGKQYSSDIEEEYRMKIFMDKLQMIENHNKKYELGLVSYNLTMNKFGDLLTDEIISTYAGVGISANSHRENTNVENNNRITFIEPENVVLPAFVDWSKKGAVTPVKDQGPCASLWAFSTTGSVEGQHFIKTKKLVSLSEQNLIDCTYNDKYDNSGCLRGSMDDSFRYIKDNGGIDTEESYPYEARNTTCRFRPNTVGATVTGFVILPQGSEQSLQAAVAKVGPVSVAIDIRDPFFYYSFGVYNNPNCDPGNVTFGLLVVGYGTAHYEGGIDYWLVKNSWGDDWGHRGYIRMARNKDNQCGIATMASYPLV